jgi:hypothetical protein
MVTSSGWGLSGVICLLTCVCGCGGVERECSEPLLGEGAFGQRLSGAGAFQLGGERGYINESFALDIYFPDGRVPAVDGVLAITNPGRGLQTESFRVGELNTHLAFLGYDGRSFRLNGQLVAPDDGIRATVDRTFVGSTGEVTGEGTASLSLCPAGPPPAPILSTVVTYYAPTTTLLFAPTAPLDMTRLQIRAEGNGVEIPLDAEVRGGQLAVRSREPMFPPNVAVVFDSSAVADVLGRVVPLSGPMRPLQTYTPVRDFEFNEEPPLGAMDWTSDDGVVVVDGLLRIGGGQSGYEVLVELGDLPAGQLGLELLVSECEALAYVPLSAAVVSADGHANQIALMCPLDSTVWTEIPAPGPTWLAFSQAALLRSAGGGLPITSTQLQIDAIRFM